MVVSETNGVESTLSSLLMCRFRPHGCAYAVRYQPGQYEWARQTMDAHEVSCVWRFMPNPHDPS